MERTFSIGVDLGGTNLRVAAYSSEGEFLQTITLATRLADGRDCVANDLCESVSALRAEHARTRRLVGIGVGSPGPLELPSGILRNPPNLLGWDGFNLREAIESSLDEDILLENDANLAALAEQVCGAGRTAGTASLCMLTLGTGVGSGLILDGEIWHGISGMGGEAGHIVVDPDGPPCGCGGRGCLEQYASASAMIRMMSEASKSVSNAREVAELANAGDEAAKAVFVQVGRALAVALTGAINTLNLPLYVIGGGGSGAWDAFAPTMFQELLSRSYIYRLTAASTAENAAFNANKTQICRAQLGSDAGLLGACLLGLRGTPSTKVIELERRVAS